MKVLVCGDRHWTNKDLIRQHLIKLNPDIIINGAAKGADKLSTEVAIELLIEYQEYPANWKIGRGAGPIRNKQMLQTKPDLVLAFHNNIRESKGTLNCIEQARKLGIEVRLINE